MMKFVLVCFLAYLGAGFADAKNYEDISELASHVCKTTKSSHTKHHLNNLASVTGVIDYLSGVASGHKLEECRDKYLESLQQLVQVVNANSDDICGEEKVTALEDYHRRYVSKHIKYEKLRKHKSKAPKLAKVFFMQYASKVSSICAQAALEGIIRHAPPTNGEEMAKLYHMKNLTTTLGLTDFSNGYDGIYLFWNMVDSLNLHKTDKFSKYLVQEGENRLHVQMKQAKGLVEAQTICRNHLKPIYSKSILPVLRLADLGYYPESTSLLTTEGAVRDLLYATQVCQTLLPVVAYKNDSLDKSQIVAITKEDASSMTPYESPELSPAQPFDIPPSSLSGAELNFAGIKSDKIKARVDSRGRFWLIMLKKMVKRLKKMKSLVKSFKLETRGENKNLEPIDEDYLEEMAERSLQAYEKSETGLVRKKRQVIIIIVVAVVVILILAAVVYYVSKHFNPDG